MSDINVENLLQPISSESPCGENLEYDTAFGELERSTQTKAEQQFGDKIIPGEGPDWRRVKKNALELLERTKDVRVGMYLAHAVLNTDALPEFGSVLEYLRGLVERYWDTFHPVLDPDDDNDPTIRVNSLVGLCDQNSTLKFLNNLYIVRSKSVGRFSIRDIEVAAGDIPAPANPPESPPSQTIIDAAFQDVDIEELKAMAKAATDSIDHINAIELGVTTNVGVGNAASLAPIVEVLKKIQKALNEQLTRRGVAEPGTEEAMGGAGEAGGDGEVAKQLASGNITCRDDAIRMLDKICEYYELHEPSSPLPLLIRRAKRLATKSFLEIIRDLTPDAFDQASAIGGPDESQST